ncbi:MAG: hypothetical protein WC132_05495 [Methanomethylophilus sp.]
MSKKVILFFIAGMVPTDAEREAAEKLGTARFRNAQLAKNDTVEKCDEVAGLVPEIYKNVKGIKVLDVKAEEPVKETAPVAPSPQAPVAPAQPKPAAPAPAPATKK